MFRLIREAKGVATESQWIELDLAKFRAQIAAAERQLACWERQRVHHARRWDQLITTLHNWPINP